jgi:hypothetical protein
METYKTPSVTVLLVSGLAAGILAYAMSRRSQKKTEILPVSRDKVVARAKDLVAQGDLARIGREYVSDRVVPEMKPILLEVLKDFEDYVERYFERAEKAIKSM